MGVGRAGPVRGAVCSCATIVGGSPRGILDLMRGRGRKSLGVVVMMLARLDILKWNEHWDNQAHII